MVIGLVISFSVRHQSSNISICLILFFFNLSPKMFSTSCKKIQRIVRFHEVYLIGCQPLAILLMCLDMCSGNLRLQEMDSKNCSAFRHCNLIFSSLSKVLVLDYLTVTSLVDFEILCFLKLQFILPLSKKVHEMSESG